LEIGPEVSVILPTYDESQNVQELISAILNCMEPAPEIIVVDDDSPDGTWEIVTKIQAEHPNVKLLRRIGKRGLATAVAEGIASSRGDIIVWMDSDFSHPPALIPQLVKALEHCSIALASRYTKGGGSRASPLRVWTARLVNILANVALGYPSLDWTSGFIAVKREVVEKVEIAPVGTGYGEYFMDFLFRARKASYPIEQIPYTYIYRKRGVTKTSPNMLKLLGLGFSYCRCIFSLIGIDLLSRFQVPQ
jgi:dolichol-phosphate mannosyltransferase